jgi:TonB family protein
MQQDILVVEYEPRYTERIRQALAGQPLALRFARDGEEALAALAERVPGLIVLSSIVPKINTPELLRIIQSRPQLATVPILITISGYGGTTPEADAQKIGASDFLPKPYSEADFLSKIKQLLGSRAPRSGTAAEPAVAAGGAPQGGALSSEDIFGDLLKDEMMADSEATRNANAKKDSEELDKMLAETLSGIRLPSRKKEEKPAAPAPAAAPQPAAPAPPSAKNRGDADLDDLLATTLSGLDVNRRTRPAERPAPAPAPAAPEAPPIPAVVPDEPFPEAAAPPASAALAVPAAMEGALPQPAAEAQEEDGSTEGSTFGQYILLEKIATGGMAEVWKARMRGVEGFQKTVAIKKILPHLSDNEDFVTMFIDEAKLAAQLSHNNIIHIYDLGRISSSYYIAMEFIDGCDLKTILRRAEDRGLQINVELALFVASKIAAALDYAHRKRDFSERELGLVHRDVSPQNVLISHEGDIKLCDFGIAKAASKASHTQAGALKGKLQYMSPEQAWGRQIDRRSDVFALATVLFEMLTGRKLFSGDNELSILEQVREAKIVAPSEFNDEVTAEIDALVVKALQKDPDARYQTAGELARDLDTVLYSFRPTPASADLAIYMHRLFVEEEAAATVSMPMPVFDDLPVPELPRITDTSPRIEIATPQGVETVIAPLVEASPAAVFDPEPVVEPAASEPPQKRSLAIPIAAAAVLVVALAAGGFMMARRSAPEPAPARVVEAAVVSPAVPIPAAPTPEEEEAVMVEAVDSALAQLTVTTGTSLGEREQAIINEEVRKRLEAERLRLEQQRQQAAAEERARLEAEAAATAAQQPAPATDTTVPARTAAAPATDAAPPQVAAPTQPPQSPAVETRRYREGELVAVGTPGLTPPTILQPRRVDYPPLALRQKVEGLVIVSVLVSEDGKALEAKILRGSPLLNPAALEAARGTRYQPATIDGVKVRSYFTYTIPFRL